MTSFFTRISAVVGISAAAAGAVQAQGWHICDPFPPAVAESTAYANAHTFPLFNSLMHFEMDLAGTVTQGGGTTGPCWPAPITGNGPGGFALSIGSDGSVQSTFDDNMELTYGAPDHPAIPWCFATVNVDATRTAFGPAGISGFVDVASGNQNPRAVDMFSIVNGTTVELRVDLIADALRFDWKVTNNSTTVTHAMSVWFGAFVAMLTEDLQNAGGPGNIFPPYVLMPGRRPLATETKINRQDPNFPDFVDFYFDQSHPYGFRLENGPTPATADQNGQNSDADFIDELTFGDPVGVIGGISGNQTFNDQINPLADWGAVVIGGANAAFLQKIRPKTAGPGETVEFVNYVRAPWGLSNYSEPYCVVADAPTLIPTDSTTASGLQADGAFSLAVNVDNTARPGFTDVNKPAPIQSVRVKLSFPPLANGDSNGLSADPSEITAPDGSITKNIIGSPALPILVMKQVVFSVVADGIRYGDLPYTVTITPSTGPVKVLNGTITVAATPRIRLFSSPQINLITAPWEFADSSWEAVLGLSPTDFQAFNWDPLQNGYVISSSAERGVGNFIIYSGSDPSINFGSAFYQSNPQEPTDLTTGIQLRIHSGWNLIGNPYNYSFPLSQLVGVSDADNITDLTWQELVDANIVSDFLAFWDPNANAYGFIQDINQPVLPNVGYWIFVQTPQDLTLIFPPIFAPGLPGAGGVFTHGLVTPSLAPPSTPLWKLQLVARTSRGVDSQNWVGGASDSTAVKRLNILKPPLSPVGDLQLSLTPKTGGRGYAGLYNVGTGPQDFNAIVSSKNGGTVTLTWPTLSTLPSGFGATITDPVTHVTQDLRKAPSYSLSLARNSSRTLAVHVTPAPTVNLITNISKTLGNGSINFTYKLSLAAVTSAKISTSAGRDVVQLTTNRHDLAGTDKLTWNLRDSSNRPVSSGTYVITITGTTSSGQVDTEKLQFSR
jgi:hypothetical protein